MTALRRIQKELSDLTNKPIDGMSVHPVEDNLFHWEGSVKGASDSPYKGGTFKFKVDFPDNFPFKAPSVTFTTKIYHPGINEEGSICVPILRDQWKPTVSISTGNLEAYVATIPASETARVVLSVIQEKVNNPSPDDPYEPDIAALLKTDKAKFTQTAKDWTKKHAM